MRKSARCAQEAGPTVVGVLSALGSPFAVYTPVAAILLGTSVSRSPATALGLALAGLLLWTLLEYLFHRFVLHLLPRGGARRLLAGRHLLHHKNPTGHPGVVLVWVSALNGSL